MQHLYDLAESLDVRIEYADLTHLDRDGDCSIDSRTIRLQPGMLYRLERSVLAHELAHMIRGDRRTILGHYDDKDERRADEWAAHFLIDINSYSAAESRFGTNTEAIAQELEVMDWIVEAYERTMQRIGNDVYFNAKMGVGQWALKVTA
ncbi:ImmA/IrrE family metallo-endopeptidase [Leucobacter sp. UT-8R-CII-1-4]|uniref:ImmA/IrrE family metallo-endopeptidase n=1 Tax=Leucobacter sp. UT-8R-CII-1-4 TaxID=3040075 RepID=UPI0024A8A323|nr:ImmA/IrrE family metallo-endopeptidase [Leucobacter sp. UT-8R-CII-1-4]MDI6023623.1 ImmA/IrrE family metallo-endopeptidase [Leucobacter sp. UT-8R-CII-1-4]